MSHAAVLVFPGSNREHDVAAALKQATGHAPTLVWHGETSCPKADLIVLPGGFSYGDYLRCGAMAAHSPIMRDVVAKARAGVPVLGICNGFQILCEAGLLPGVLMRNASLKFICKQVRLRVEATDTPFTQAYEPGHTVMFPIAHAEGNYFADTPTLDALDAERRVLFRYVDAEGQATPEGSPNGAQRNIAGICDASRRILGLMPHPENVIDPAQGGIDGRGLFNSLAQSILAH